jgi:hypothetical protein
MNKPIDTAALLNATMGATPPPMNSRMIGHLDRVALRWIAASPLMFAAFGDTSGLNVTLGGGEAGFASGDTYELRLPVARLDDPALAVPGQGFGSLFLLPCIGEMMHVNGTVREVRNGEIRIAVEECYGHCDKALIRSEYWAALLQMLAPQGVGAFAAASRFMALATVDAWGRVELSPKDDPACILARIESGATCFTERPGSQVFGHHLPQPQVAAMVLVLGSAQVTRLSGNARISADLTACAPFVFQDETSALVAIIEDAAAEVGESRTLLCLNDWPGARRVRDMEVAKPFAGHIRRSRDKGLGAELASAAVSVPGVSDLLRKGLETDHRDYLYSVPS